VLRPRFLTVGDLMLDVAVSGAGHDASVIVRPGGSAANAAVWAAACGAEVAVVGRVGDDLAGRALRAALEERGVETRLAVDAERPTGTFAVVDGEIRADRGANAGGWSLPELDADVILVSTYLDEEVVRAAVEQSRAGWVAVQGKPVEGANAVFLNERETEESLELLGERFRLACVTAGPEGAAAVLDGEFAHAQVSQAEEGTATGAGDAFAAAVLVSLAQGLPLQHALAEGCRCGALAVASPDGWPVP
jgi:ribokinase